MLSCGWAIVGVGGCELSWTRMKIARRESRLLSRGEDTVLTAARAPLYGRQLTVATARRCHFFQLASECLEGAREGRRGDKIEWETSR